MQFVCVVNPVSGRGKGPLVTQRLQKQLVERGHEVTLLETTPDQDRFRQECCVITEQSRVICIGGDGTLLYFLNICNRFHSVAFYGMGTANVMAIEFGLPKKIEDFVAMLERGRTRIIKPGVCQDGTRFLMMLSFGIDGSILKSSSQKLKNRLGKLAFLPPALRALLFYRYPRLELRLDDGQVVGGSMVVISRIQHYGGPLNIAPNADPSSDYFEVLVVNGGFWRTLRFFLRLFLGGSHHQLSYVQGYRSHKIEILPFEEGYLQMDGNLHLDPVTQLSVDSWSIPLIVP